MKLKKSKYNIGQTVFILLDNKIKEKMITGVIYQVHNSTVADKGEYAYTYDLKWQSNEVQWISEKYLFKSRTQLINTL